MVGAFKRLLVGDALHAGEPLQQEIVGGVLDPLRHVRVRRTAVRRVVFETAVGGRIVRRRDDDAVGEARRAPAVVIEDGVRNGRRRRVFVRSAIITSMPLAASTSSALAPAGADNAWVSSPRNNGPSMPCFWRYRQMACVMASTCFH